MDLKEWAGDHAEMRMFLGRLAADSTKKGETNQQWLERIRVLRDILHAKLEPVDALPHL